MNNKEITGYNVNKKIIERNMSVRSAVLEIWPDVEKDSSEHNACYQVLHNFTKHETVPYQKNMYYIRKWYKSQT